MSEDKYEKFRTGYEGNNESMVLYDSYLEVLERFSDAEQLQAYRAISHYGIRNEMPDLDSLPFGAQITFLSAYATIRGNLDNRFKPHNGMGGNKNAVKGMTCRKCKSYRACHKQDLDKGVCERFEFNPKMVQNQNRTKTEQNNNVNVNVNDNVNVNVNGNVNKELSCSSDQNQPKQTWVKPTREELEAFCKEKHYSFSLDDYIEYYEASEWKYKDGTYVNWQKACANWHINHKNDKSASKSGPAFKDDLTKEQAAAIWEEMKRNS